MIQTHDHKLMHGIDFGYQGAMEGHVFGVHYRMPLVFNKDDGIL